jgi:probable F420-dependent oxidoreductase
LKVGVSLPQAGQQATRENTIQMAKNSESEGFDSLWVFERLLWPIKPQTPYGGTPDGSLPIEYQIMLDPLETLTYIAANTNKIALGTSVIDMLFHNPVILARRFATLDVLSEGRTIAGLGIGWSKDEYQASNIPFQNRGKRADEFIQVLKRIWTDDVVEFKGDYYSIPASKIGPKPVQKPHPPIYLGGFSPNTFSRIVNYDTNNFKIILLAHLNVDLDSKSQSITKVNEAQRLPFTGTIDQIGDDIKRIKQMDMDIDHIVFGYNFIPIGRDVNKMLDITKQLAKFAR